MQKFGVARNRQHNTTLMYIFHEVSRIYNFVGWDRPSLYQYILAKTHLYQTPLRNPEVTGPVVIVNKQPVVQ